MSDRSPRGDNDDGARAAPRDHVDDVLERLRLHQARSGRHEVRQELGRGGMGLVLEVHDRDLLRPLAMKRLRAERRNEEDPERRRHFIARFLQEAQITGQLGHPGIPPVHELALDAEGEPFFTMPLIRGKTLEVVLDDAHRSRNGWNVPRALAVLLKVCEAMSFAHAKKIVHRDLKPANVMIGRFGEVYVMDWGLARVIGSDRPDVVRWSSHGQLSSVDTDRKKTAAVEDAPLETLDGDVLGTPFFMPPEQASGDQGRVGARSDIYAVGAMLYLLLTGRPPYAPSSGNISPRVVLGLVMHGPPTPIKQVAHESDPDLVAICEKAMAREIDRRYQTMEELAADIEAWLGRRPIRATPPTIRHALGLFAERHKTAVATAAAGLVSLLAAGSIFVWRLANERDLKELARREAERRGDLMSAVALRKREEDLWPAAPHMISSMGQWLDDVAGIESRLADYRAEYLNMDGSDNRRPVLDALFSETEALIQLGPAVERRLRLARDLRRSTIDDVKDAWQQAIDRISASPRFAGLRMTPQLGLVPLGENRQSGLEEFWHVASGERPVVGPDGDARAGESTGIVLVLLPAADLTVGYRVDEPRKHRIEAPRAVSVDSFLVSKWEVTQGQWFRVMASNPARCQSGVHAGVEENLSHPIESVSWTECARFAERTMLTLPTTIQWEYFARAGSDSVYGYGPEFESLEGYENVRDRSWGSPQEGSDSPWLDGFVFSSPVGHFRPNAFGLHDVLANVAEWCRDEFKPEAAVGLGEPEAGTRAFRGGSYFVHPKFGCRPAQLQWDGPGGRNHTRGLRPVRELTP